MIQPKIICPYCEHPNNYGELVCANCDKPLFVDTMTKTRTFTAEKFVGTDDHPTPLWGSARFARTFTVHVDDKPVATAVIGKNPIIIGRSDAEFKPDIDLGPYSAQDLGVSRKHLEVRKIAEGLAVRDQG